MQIRTISSVKDLDHEVGIDDRSDVIRLSLGRRWVDLLPVAQRTNACLLQLASTAGHEFESHFEHFFSKNCLRVRLTINMSPWAPRIIKEHRSRHVQPHTKTKNPAVQRGGECYKA